ncbi:hypothetical protein DB346_11390 [Verrucomicrobia bacterium LW23]|nr:hypothetical protein DB346_11390 [Verrucomicrobia bacterium LW23]
MDLTFASRAAVLAAAAALALAAPAAIAQEAAGAGSGEFKVGAPVSDIRTPEDKLYRIYQAEGMFRIDSGNPGSSSRKTFIYNTAKGLLFSLNYRDKTYTRVPINLPANQRSQFSNRDNETRNDIIKTADAEKAAVNGAFNYDLTDMRQLSEIMLGTTTCERYSLEKDGVRTTVYLSKDKGYPMRITRQSRDGSSSSQIRIFEFTYPNLALPEGTFEPPMDFRRVAPLIDPVDPALLAAERADPGAAAADKPAEGEHAAATPPGDGTPAAPPEAPAKPKPKVPENEPFLSTKPLL